MSLKTHFFHLLHPKSGEMLIVKVKTAEDFIFARNRACDIITLEKNTHSEWSLDSVISALGDVFEEVSIL